MNKSYLLGVAVAATLSLLSTASNAQNPSSDVLCDELTYATPGLYGLCVAYWATNGIDNPGDPPSNAKILEKYRAKMQPGDPDMPGLPIDTDCPCWSLDRLADASDGVNGNEIVEVECTATVGLPTNGANVSETDIISGELISRLSTSEDSIAAEPTCWDFPNGSTMLITTEEYQSCYSQISSVCQ